MSEMPEPMTDERLEDFEYYVGEGMEFYMELCKEIRRLREENARRFGDLHDAGKREMHLFAENEKHIRENAKLRKVVDAARRLDEGCHFGVANVNHLRELHMILCDLDEAEK